MRERVILHAPHPADPLQARRLVAAAEAVLEAEAIPPIHHLELHLLDDGTMQRLNAQLFGRDCPTDVIAQPYWEPGDPDPLLGEVFISWDRAVTEAAARHIPFEEELLRYLVHGVLHLCGYRDTEPEAKAAMWERQETLLRRLPDGSS